MGDSMKVYAYGEDALTLWAIKNRLPEILGKLGDKTKLMSAKYSFALVLVEAVKELLILGSLILFYLQVKRFTLERVSGMDIQKS